jgi:hypothetical protein
MHPGRMENDGHGHEAAVGYNPGKNKEKVPEIDVRHCKLMTKSRFLRTELFFT